jgi:DNA-binding NarL/FixJ family response regulator
LKGVGTMAEKRVLIVDDNAKVRRELHTVLALTGEVEVVGEAKDGWEAIRQTETLQPDVVVMDLEMPVMDGYEATRQIKVQQPAPRVIILSIHAGAGEEERARAVGADAFVVKGTNYQTLLNAILGRDESPNSFELKKGEML